MKVIFDLAAGKLAIEGDAPELLKVLDAARNLAPSISQIQITAKTLPEARTTLDSGEPQVADRANGAAAAMTLRQFVRSLSLDNMSERIAAIAYYVNKTEGRPAFSPKEMDGWFTMCGFQKPAQMPLALFDAKRKHGYAESASRGAWRISNQGENLIIRKVEEGREVH